MEKQKTGKNKGLALKILITWLCILSLAGFSLAMKASSNPVTMSVMPQAPKEGEAIVVTYAISNSTDTVSETDYRLYVNGDLLESGTAAIAPNTVSKHQYAYTNTLKRGEQVSFVLETTSGGRENTRAVSLPAYPPQILSSFVSFAAFSTSVMSSMMSMEYFTSTFGVTSGVVNAGIIMSIVLIALLIFFELVPAIATTRGVSILGRYRFNLRTLASILFIIFIGMVFTRVVMIIASIG